MSSRDGCPITQMLKYMRIARINTMTTRDIFMILSVRKPKEINAVGELVRMICPTDCCYFRRTFCFTKMASILLIFQYKPLWILDCIGKYSKIHSLWENILQETETLYKKGDWSIIEKRTSIYERQRSNLVQWKSSPG